MLNWSPPHLRLKNVSRVSGKERVLCVETRWCFEVYECIKDSHLQSAVYALNLHDAVPAGYRPL